MWQLPVTAALDFMAALGVERYRDALFTQARAAAAMLAAAWDVDPGAPADLCASMVTLPLPVNDAATPESVMQWRLRLRREHAIEVPIIAINGRLWVRISAQVYNELSDYEALARVFAR